MLKECFKRFLAWWEKIEAYIVAVSKWVSVAITTGIFCGIIGSVFHHGVHIATELRAEHPWLLWCLPVAGLGVVGFYKLMRTEGQGTNDIIEAVHHGKGLSILLLPAIFVGTILTHLCGGSAGREGAALQMGGTIGYHTARLCNLDDRDMRTATLTGMAAFFSALFGTPMAATVFAIVVISVGVMYHAAFIPCFTASLVAYAVSLVMGVEPTRFNVQIPILEVPMLLRVGVLAVLCAFVSVIFCNVIHVVEHQMHKQISNSWTRVITGGVAIALLTTVCGTTDYNGAGMEVITAAVEEGVVAHPAAFLLKILFTAVTLAAGFKGGEVVPSFFVGATFGCVMGPILGIPAGFAASLGLVAVFCGATNCPIASIFLAIELFGEGGLLYFALTCGLSYMLSGYNGLYSSQTILYSKLKAQYINVRTNAHHEGKPHAEPLDRGSLKE